MTGRACSRVYTVGHSTREFAELVLMLRNNGVTRLVDVRRFPHSRRFPQFDEAAIAEALPADIAYQRIPQLGGRRHTPQGVASPNGAWRVKAFRDYADYMATDDFRAGLDELLHLAGHETPAIMCSEALPWRCHRRLITDALIVAGVRVEHIMSPTSTKAAVLDSNARVEDGRLTYPPPPDDG
jgi:uncharacterized protein (DUF488 family)